MVIINDQTNRTGCARVIAFRLIIESAAAGDDRNLSAEVESFKILRRAVAVNKDIFQRAEVGDGAERILLRNLLRRAVITVIIGNIPSPYRNIGRNHTGVFNSRDGQRFIISRRLTRVAIVRVGGKCLAAVIIVVRGRIVIAYGNCHADAALTGAVKNINEIHDPFIFRFIINKAANGAKGHIDRIDT